MEAFVFPEEDPDPKQVSATIYLLILETLQVCRDQQGTQSLERLCLPLADAFLSQFAQCLLLGVLSRLSLASR